MSEKYKLPDDGEMPKIKVSTDEKFSKPELKHLFIKYNGDEWETEEDAVRVIRKINSLFGTNVQITVIGENYDILSGEEIKELVEDQ